MHITMLGKSMFITLMSICKQKNIQNSADEFCFIFVQILPAQQNVYKQKAKEQYVFGDKNN